MKRFKSLLSVILVAVVLWVSVLPVRAEGYILKNDGNPIGVPYGDSGLPSSYKGADYYDVFIPYNMSVQSVGGYKRTISDSIKKADVGAPSFNGEKAASCPVGCLTFKGSSTTTKADEYKDSAGNIYYACNSVGFWYNFGGLSIDTSDFPDFSSCSGQLMDAILTDGTVIHFVIFNPISNGYTNGGFEDGSYAAAGEMIKMNDSVGAYKNMFDVETGEIFRVMFQSPVSQHASFNSTFGFGNDVNKTKVAIIRMYNLRLSDSTTSFERADGVESESAYQSLYTFTSIQSAGDYSYTPGDNSLNMVGSSLVEEWELKGMPERSYLGDSQSTLQMADRNGLAESEIAILTTLRDNVDIIRKVNVFDILRTVMTFVGIMLMIYSVLLIMAVLFDRVNTFIDFSLVNLITLGLLNYDPWEESSGSGGKARVGYASTKKMIVSICVIMVVGIFMVSGGLLKVMGRLMLWFMSNFL